MAKTIIVSNRLPVRLEKQGEKLQFKASEGGLATGLGSIYKEGDNLWIGWPGLEVGDDQKTAISEELSQQNMRPVFLTAQELEDYYLGFSNQTLWPAFHYFVQYIQYNEARWVAYRSVNEKFAQTILSYAEPDDVIWVHDYQLMLVPALLREALPEASIGFFQHIPFPSFEVLRMLPWRQALLEGVLGSDFIGFHTYDDMRHFLSSVHRLTGYVYRANKVNVERRTVAVDALPMGIDYEKYYQKACSREVADKVQEFRSAFGPQRMVLSVDRLDYSKGIPDRLRAYRRFLEDNPAYHTKVSLILVVVPSRDQVPSYQQLKDEVDELVGKINGALSTPTWQPVHYFYRSFDLTSLSAFYRLSEVAMITPLRDGMNLVCKEYIASRFEGKGALILSEMAGSAKELSEAILVNPNDERALAESLLKGLEMPLDEQSHRLKLMQESLRRYTIFQWVKLFNQNLAKTKKEQSILHSTRLKRGKFEPITSAYAASQQKLVFLDYDGTLVPFDKDPEVTVPDKELRDLLQETAAVEQLDLVLISGRPRDFLEKYLGHLPVTLAAEHGIWLRPKNEEWQPHAELPDERWKEEARSVIDFYVNRTPGSFLEEKQHALAWHYRSVETGLARLRCSELSSHLKHMLGDKGLEVLEGNAVVEIKPASINKGVIAHNLQRRLKPDFTLAIGDDRTDEDIFEALPEQAFTIKVGDGQTRALYSLDDHEAVRSLLKALLQADR